MDLLFHLQSNSCEIRLTTTQLSSLPGWRRRLLLYGIANPRRKCQQALDRSSAFNLPGNLPFPPAPISNHTLLPSFSQWRTKNSKAEAKHSTQLPQVINRSAKTQSSRDQLIPETPGTWVSDRMQHGSDTTKCYQRSHATGTPQSNNRNCSSPVNTVPRAIRWWVGRN